MTLLPAAMTHEELCHLALEVAQEVGIRFDPIWGTYFEGNSQLERFALRFLAAVAERQEPVAWLCEWDHWMDSYNHYELTKQLVAAQAREAKLREFLDDAVAAIQAMNCCDNSCDPPVDCSDFTEYLALPADDSTLREALAQERERCAKIARKYEPDERFDYVTYASDEIRSMK